MIARTTRKFVVMSLQGMLLLFLVVAAVYVSIGRIVIRNVDLFQSDFEEIVSRTLNVPVTVSALEGGWTYLDPKLIVRDLVVGSEENPAIDLKRIVLGLDTIASLIHMKPVVREIEIRGLTLALEKDASGLWFVAGLPRSDKPFNSEPLFDAVSSITSVRLDDASIDVFGDRVHYNISSDAEHPFELRRKNKVRTLSWPLTLKYVHNESITSTRFKLAGQYEGNLLSKDFRSELYLQLPTLELVEFLPLIEFQDFNLTSARVSGEFWISSKDSRLTVKGLSQVESVTMHSNNKEVRIIEGVDVQFSAKGSEDDGVMVYLEKLTGRVGGEDWQLNEVSFAAARQDSQASGASTTVTSVRTSLAAPDNNWLVVANVPSVSLEKVSKSLSFFGGQFGFLTPKNLTGINSVNLKGVIKNLMISGILGGEKPDLKVTAELVDIRTDQYETSPSISHLNGFVSLSPDHGYVDIHNDFPFEVRYPVLFPETWHFDSAHARMFYDNRAGELKIRSGLMQARKGGLVAKGKVVLNLPKDAQKHNWGLELGVRNAELLEARRYIPSVVSTDLKEWLLKSVLGGSSPECGVIIHGSLGKATSKDQKAHEIYLQVQDAILDYDPVWPRIDDLAATVYVGNRKVHSEGAAGTAFDSRLFGANVLVPISAEGDVDTLFVDASMEGPFSDGIRMLTETPLFELTSELADGWQGEGLMRGNAKFNIPLGARTGQETQADLVIAVEDTHLNLPAFDLELSGLTGDFTYETTAGINTNAFNAMLFDKNVVGKISTSGDPDGGIIVIDIDGSIDVLDLYHWSDQSLLTQAAGILDYRTTLNIPYGVRDQEPIWVSATSGLVGVNINLPAPLGKTDAEEMKLSFRQAFLDPGYDVEIELGSKMHSAIKIMDGVLVGGRIHFGEEKMGAVAFNKLKVSGFLENLLFGQWETLSENLEGRSTVSLEQELAETLDAVDLVVGRLNVDGFEVDDVETYITRNPDAWKVSLRSSMLQGTIVVLDDDDAPLDINLDFLKFETEESSEGDPFWDVDPAEMLAADYHVSKLFLDGEDYGRWSFGFRPGVSGSVLESFTADVKGLQVRGDGKVNWQYADGQHNSNFKGSILVSDLADTLQQWGFASSIEGKNFEFQSEVDWAGSPAMVDMETVRGTVEIAKGEGRFVQADANVEALKLLGIFDFASLSRRFRLDFSDVVDKGFSFSKIRGTTRLNKGVIDVVDPIMIEGSGSIFKVAGRIDLPKGTLDNDVIVTLPVNRNLPWYAAFSAFAIGPLTGATVFLAQKLFEEQIDTISSAKYKITGTVEKPVIEFVSIFSDSVRETPESIPAEPPVPAPPMHELPHDALPNHELPTHKLTTHELPTGG